MGFVGRQTWVPVPALPPTCELKEVFISFFLFQIGLLNANSYNANMSNSTTEHTMEMNFPSLPVPSSFPSSHGNHSTISYVFFRKFSMCVQTSIRICLFLFQNTNLTRHRQCSVYASF